MNIIYIRTNDFFEKQLKMYAKKKWVKNFSKKNNVKKKIIFFHRQTNRVYGNNGFF